MKTVLLTGSTGFLGSHLLKTLIHNQKYNIIALKRSTSNISRIASLLATHNVSYIDIDLAPFSLTVRELFSNNKIDIIIHTATNYGRNNTFPSEVLHANLLFPLSLLEAAVNNNVDLFINTDSYFNKPNQTYTALLNYSLSKKSLNIWFDYFKKKVKIINLRLEHLYGDFDSDTKFVENIIQNIAIKNIEKINLTYGQQKRDFIFVDDVCNAFLTILENYDKHIFNYLTFEAGTGISTSIKEFVETVKSYSKSTTELLFGTMPYREDEIMNSVADNSALLDWGWNYDYTIEKGIKKIIDIYKGVNY